MAYAVELYNSVDQVSDDLWRRLISPIDFPMDRRLIGLQQRTLAAQSRMWVMVVRDTAAAGGEVAAIACLGRFDLELTDLPHWIRPCVDGVRRIWRGFWKNRVLFVGLPLPCASSHLRFAEGVDRRAVLEALDQRVWQLAREDRAGFVVYKEFEDAAAPEMAVLQTRGYLRGRLPVLHEMHVRFRNFEEYLGAIKARYRNQITRSQKKFAAAGLRAVHLTDGEEIRRRFTPEVHRLYAAVHARSKTKLEFLPFEFFRELPDALPGQVAITIVESAERVVGFTLAVQSNGTHYNVYSGVDYAVNEQAHIYFNLFYHDLDYAFSTGAKEVHLGETSDGFKSRLGTEPVPLHCYVRPRNPVVRAVVRRFAGLLFPSQNLDTHEVFKNTGESEDRD